jgi:hypothetical protein
MVLFVSLFSPAQTQERLHWLRSYLSPNSRRKINQDSPQPLQDSLQPLMDRYQQIQTALTKITIDESTKSDIEAFTQDPLYPVFACKLLQMYIEDTLHKVDNPKVLLDYRNALRVCVHRFLQTTSTDTNEWTQFHAETSHYFQKLNKKPDRFKSRVERGYQHKVEELNQNFFLGTFYQPSDNIDIIDSTFPAILSLDTVIDSSSSLLLNQSLEKRLIQYSDIKDAQLDGSLRALELTIAQLPYATTSFCSLFQENEEQLTVFLALSSRLMAVYYALLKSAYYPKEAYPPESLRVAFSLHPLEAVIRTSRLIAFHSTTLLGYESLPSNPIILENNSVFWRAHNNPTLDQWESSLDTECKAAIQIYPQSSFDPVRWQNLLTKNVHNLSFRHLNILSHPHTYNFGSGRPPVQLDITARFHLAPDSFEHRITHIANPTDLENKAQLRPVRDATLFDADLLTNEDVKAQLKMLFITDGHILDRSLFQASMLPELSASLLLHLIQNNWNYLLTSNVRQYLDACIFSPFSVSLALKQADFLEQMDSFLRKGLKEYLIPSSAALFLLHLGTKFFIYALQQDKNNLAVIEKMILWLAVLEAEIPFQSFNTSVIQLRWQAYLALYESTNDSRYLDNAWVNFVLSQPFFNIQNPVTNHYVIELKRASGRLIACHAKQVMPNPRRLIDRLLRSLNLLKPHTQFDIKETALGWDVFFDGKTFLFNKTDGCLSDEHGNTFITPLDIASLPELYSLGIDSIKYMSLNDQKTSCTVYAQSCDFQLVKNTDKLYSIQKYFVNKDGSQALYELQKLSTVYAKILLRFMDTKEGLFWLAKNGDIILTQKGSLQIPIAIGKYQPKKFTYSHPTVCFHNQEGLLFVTPEYQSQDVQLVEPFEHTSFLQIVEKNPNELSIRLSRYKLTLTYDLKTNRLYYNNYRQLTEFANYFATCGSDSVEEIPLLCFENEKNPTDRVLIVSESSLGSRREPYGSIFKPSLSEINYYVFKLSENFQPEPKSAQEALYLTYLYLHFKKYDLAQEMIDQCIYVFGTLEGSLEELKYLNWIVTFANPETELLAIQLRAMSLYAKYKQANGLFNYPKESKDTSNVAEFGDLLTRLKQFELSAKKWIKTKMLSYDEHEQSIERIFHIKPSEYIALSSYVYFISQSQEKNLTQPKCLPVFTDNDALTKPLVNRQDLSKTISELEKRCLRFAQKNFEVDESTKQKYELEVWAEQRHALTIERLFYLFAQNNYYLYQKETNLSNQEIKQLHGLTAQLIYLNTEQQRLLRCARIDTLIQTSKNDQEVVLLHEERAQNADAENLVDFVRHPVLALYQFYADLLLRPAQMEVLGRLLTTTPTTGFAHGIEQLMMGAGKTKVLLPCLAAQKAGGNNLVLMMVPKNLLKTNFRDLHTASLRLFGQVAELFEFTRESKCHSQDLLFLKSRIQTIINQKSYCVTTKESLQALELKYIELLNDLPLGPQEQAEWAEQIKHLSEILTLIKQRGDLLIDEVHQELSLKYKLNFTLDVSKKISASIINQCIDVYQAIAGFKYHGLTGLDLIRNNQRLQAGEYHQFFEAFINHLVGQGSNGLLHPILKEGISELDITHYLQDKAEIVISENMKDSINDQLALFKEQITHLIPYCIKRNYSEHYGPSCASEISEEERRVSIPYSASNIPNEASRFANPLETINFTIQSMLIQGVSLPIIKSFILGLHAKARQEISDAPARAPIDIRRTYANIIFQELFGPSNHLDNLRLDDEEWLYQLTSNKLHNPDLIFEILKTSILTFIQTDQSILHSDAYNLVNMTRSCQGMTGTPWNQKTFHHQLASLTPSKDSFTEIQRALALKTIPVRAFTDLKSILHHKLRAIIDANATFKGISNEKVAKEIASFWANDPDETIKYILYFNSDQLLSALSVKDKTSIILGRSEEEQIKNRLGCGPNQRFTFFDQAHTLGTDIKQASDAQALVMLDDQTIISNAYQAILRMRGVLSGQQEIALIVPSYLERESASAILTKLENYEAKVLREDVFYGACLQLEALFRAHILDKIYKLNTPQAQQALFQKSKSFFVFSSEASLYELYGPIVKDVKTKDILIGLKNSLSDKYKLLGLNDDLSALDNQSQKIINFVQLHGIAYDKSRAQKDNLGTEVQVQTKMQVETEKELLLQTYSPDREEALYIPLNLPHFEQMALQFKTIEEICASACASLDELAGLFSPNIMASVNFYQSYKEQYRYLDAHAKSVHAVLFTKENEQMPIKAYLLSQKELAQWVNYAKKHPLTDNFWIGTTNPKEPVLLGKKPPNIELDASFQILIEQIQFFNGELALINAGSKKWLTSKAKEKMHFFEKVIYPHRIKNHEALNKLKAALDVINRIYIQMARTLHFPQTVGEIAVCAHHVDSSSLNHQEQNNIIILSREVLEHMFICDYETGQAESYQLKAERKFLQLKLAPISNFIKKCAEGQELQPDNWTSIKRLYSTFENLPDSLSLNALLAHMHEVLHCAKSVVYHRIHARKLDLSPEDIEQLFSSKYIDDEYVLTNLLKFSKLTLTASQIHFLITKVHSDDNRTLICDLLHFGVEHHLEFWGRLPASADKLKWAKLLLQKNPDSRAFIQKLMTDSSLDESIARLLIDLGDIIPEIVRDSDEANLQKIMKNFVAVGPNIAIQAAHRCVQVFKKIPEEPFIQKFLNSDKYTKSHKEEIAKKIIRHVAIIAPDLLASLNRVLEHILITDKKYTSPSNFILFSSQTRDTKDKEIARAIGALNRALILKEANIPLTVEAKNAILDAFTALTLITCKRRNRLRSTFDGLYATDTASATNLLMQFKNNAVLKEALQIQENQAEPEALLKEKMRQILVVNSTQAPVIRS